MVEVGGSAKLLMPYPASLPPHGIRDKGEGIGGRVGDAGPWCMEVHVMEVQFLQTWTGTVHGGARLAVEGVEERAVQLVGKRRRDKG